MVVNIASLPSTVTFVTGLVCMRGAAGGAAWDDDDWKLEAADNPPLHNKQIKTKLATLARKLVVSPACCLNDVRVVFGFFP
jgi:hypothetical protein